MYYFMKCDGTHPIAPVDMREREDIHSSARCDKGEPVHENYSAYNIVDVADFDDREFCYIEDNPTSPGIKDYYLRSGEPFGDEWPDNVTMKMGNRVGV